MKTLFQKSFMYTAQKKAHFNQSIASSQVNFQDTDEFG